MSGERSEPDDPSGGKGDQGVVDFGAIAFLLGLVVLALLLMLVLARH